MPGTLTIPHSQNRWKDCYAPAPVIDLTLRSNGEEKVMVMDSIGNWTPAYLAPPTNAPVITTGGAGSFIADKFWEYRYVYAAKRMFPLVQNASTGGGSPAPKSNPSPSGTANSVTNTNLKFVTVNTTGDSSISHIWIYRSEYFDTALEASVFSAGGNVFFIGEVENNPNLVAITFTDDGTIAGAEQIENDNFGAPQFQFCLYAPPTFFGFGNRKLEVEVIVASNGVITLVNGDADRWYNGRDGQTVTMIGITTGGYDNHGSFYFKWLTHTTAQLYTNISLTFTASMSITGTTLATIRGPSNVLYKSKPNNPFSWGFTDIVGTSLVPQLYAFSVGGGNGTAIALIPNLNLLKLDVEAPNRAYTLNLKNVGTPAFESSLRPFADNYVVSVHHSQFSATLEKGQNVLWGMDTQSKAIVECDGASQQPTSSMVFKSMRELSLDESDRLMIHGGFHPRLELNCIFARTNGVNLEINRCFYMHGPTKQWGMIDVFDYLCSAQLLDPRTNELKLFVGTHSGFIGEFAAEGKVYNWYEPLDITPQTDLGRGTALGEGGGSLTGTFDPSLLGQVGNWIALIRKVGMLWTRLYGRVQSVTTTHIFFDRFLNEDFTENTSGPLGAANWDYYWGLIEIQVGRSFNAQLPFAYKKLEAVWSTWRNLITHDLNIINTLEPPSVEFLGYYGKRILELALSAKAQSDSTLDLELGDLKAGEIFGLETGFPLDQSRVFGIIFKERNYGFAQLMNYELNLTADASKR